MVRIVITVRERPLKVKLTNGSSESAAAELPFAKSAAELRSQAK